ncbi:hypothetical protein GUITHDRAFT_120557 [Guillardia theta CCMP2712]|uniref:Uncharacterized protein n=1 Tax=Guillardia theta (strain CCMP2712) TaxID=905079 RepID=L1IAX4_GUITC|nr:hypothetical protein GUITHDRAFT_120557 [Guillardia theta CCMP2712]EKX33242.1 hypothetical protein GUITHDRAFT_120557 [Guillardia theta CCMP2712]|eukprot:XP_005820222.1 hypothetical protein GUITHDRAFT_120557 [Guillardia theta CCMP2712]
MPTEDLVQMLWSETSARQVQLDSIDRLNIAILSQCSRDHPADTLQHVQVDNAIQAETDVPSNDSLLCSDDVFHDHEVNADSAKQNSVIEPDDQIRDLDSKPLKDDAETSKTRQRRLQWTEVDMLLPQQPVLSEEKRSPNKKGRLFESLGQCLPLMVMPLIMLTEELKAALSSLKQRRSGGRIRILKKTLETLDDIGVVKLLRASKKEAQANAMLLPYWTVNFGEGLFLRNDGNVFSRNRVHGPASRGT